LDPTIRVHVDQERNSSSAVEKLHSIKIASVTPRVVCALFYRKVR
jgi:hypothetical protein